MHSSRIFYGLALGAGTLLLGAVLAGTPAAEAGGPAAPAAQPAAGAVQATAPLTTCLTWNLVAGANPADSDSDLYATSIVSPTDIWAVGTSWDSNFYAHTLTEHWDGSAWSQVPSPDPGLANNFLFGVAATAPDNAWAVGWKASTNVPNVLFLHWDGSSWTESDESIAAPQVVLYSISAVSASDIWAVGRSCETPRCLRRVTAIVHYDGTAWSLVPSANPTDYDNTLSAVTARAANDVWAVGEACTDDGCGGSHTLVEHWNGTAWSVVSSPSPAGGPNRLYGVSFLSDTDAWAVGSSCTTFECATMTSLTLRWNGTTWATVASPNPGSADTHLNAVLALGADDAWAVGSASADWANYSNAIFHWNGTAWSSASGPKPGKIDNTLRALAAISPTDIWAVGTYRNDVPPSSTQVLHYLSGPCGTPTPTATVTPGPATATPTVTETVLPSATTTPTVTETVLPSATPCAITFGDVATNDYFYTPVQSLACRGVIGGYADGSYRPYNPTTRGQMAKIVALGLSLAMQTPTGAQTFADVAPGSNFYPYVETLAAQGIAGGYTCGTANPETGAAEPCVGPTNRPYFRPANAITRGQLVKFVALAAVPQRGWTLLHPATPTFGDVPAGSAFYDYIETAVAHGAISGYGDGTFRPGAGALRGQIAKIVYLASTAP